VQIIDGVYLFRDVRSGVCDGAVILTSPEGKHKFREKFVRMHFDHGINRTFQLLRQSRAVTNLSASVHALVMLLV